MHSPEYLKQWYHAHLFGKYPKKEFDPVELPKQVLDAFGLNKDGMTIIGDGNLSNAKIEFSKSEGTEIFTEDSVNARYSIEYLKKLIKGGKLSDKVIIRWNTDYPLKLEYNVLDKLALSFILAPRISED